jgi:uroporphyrin-III C-methyltransferase/precorrin-2 dehydrogenase/sirohydrochlorin ferrochelatase
MSPVVGGSGDERLYPVFLRLARCRVVVVGGGPVAASKLAGLAGTGARISVVAPEIVAEIRRSGATLIQREFVPGDLDGAWLAVAAAPAEVNRSVRAAADERGIFVNAVDDPGNASAYLGGVLRRDGVTVAVSTQGRAPALAGLLREALDAVLPEELGTWVAAARGLRERQRSMGLPLSARRPALLEALNRLYARAPRAAVSTLG